MKIGGLEKLSLIDYPGEISAVVFTVGCTFRCPFCYNPVLVLPKGEIKNSSLPKGEEGEGRSSLNEDGLFHFLKTRQGKLDAVVITGGEPTKQPDLLKFIRKIKKLGFKIKLDTNGTNPEMLKKILAGKLVDYLAMDLKAAPADYEHATGARFDFEKIKESVKIIKESGLPYEFRTTCVPGFIDKKSVKLMGELIADANKWYLQRFKSDTGLIDKSLEGKANFTEKEMKELIEIGKKYAKFCEVRG
jgi:pyruvate formate lyase activating enzyme